MIVRIDATSPVPPYEQLRAQIAVMIASGRLSPGHQLPPIRQLAADVRLAPGTVARAYRELEGAGLVVSGGRRGTRVADAPPVPDAQVVAERLDDAARTFAAAAVQLGVDGRAALGAAQRAFAAVDPT